MWAQSQSEDEMPPPFKGEIKGIKNIIGEMNRLSIDADRAMSMALTTAVADIAGNADEMVPGDTGQLRASQHIEYPKARGGRTIEASITYGGPSAPYAIVQHENPDLWHPPKPPGKRVVGGKSGQGPTEPGNRTFGGPKYLEHPFDQEVQTWPQGFRDRLIAAGMAMLK